MVILLDIYIYIYNFNYIMSYVYTRIMKSNYISTVGYSLDTTLSINRIRPIDNTIVLRGNTIVLILILILIILQIILYYTNTISIL